MSPLYAAVMLAVWEAPLPPEPPQPANPATTHANSSKPAATYPARLLIDMRRCEARNAIKSNDRMPSGNKGTCGGVRGRVNGGTNCESAVVNVAVQNAFPELDAVAVQVAAVPKLLEPFLNCTVPVGPAPLLVVEIVAISVTLPPATILVTLLATAAEVAALVIVTDSVLLLPFEL